MKNIFRYSLLVCMLIILASCAEDTSEQFEKEKFARIYDNDRFDESYSALDLIETPDKGFMILANRAVEGMDVKSGIYLLKVDESGNIVKDFQMEDTYENAVPKLMMANGKYYFFCMSTGSTANLIEFDEAFEAFNMIPVNLTYPAAATYLPDEGFLLLSYDQVDKKMVFSKLEVNGNIQDSKKFSISDDDSMEEPIIRHFLKTGPRFPFEVGRIPSGLYYFNGFIDYTFSLVFTSLGDNDDVDSFIYGQHDDGGMSSVIPLSTSTFAASYFNFGANYIIPKVSMTDNISSIDDLPGVQLRELVPNAPVKLKTATSDTNALLIYGTDTRSKQIGLFFYNQADGVFRGSKYLGFSNPYEIGNFIQTSDGGLAVAGTTYIAGRFPRICLIKISKEELQESLQ